ncbi:MAG TPA: flagellar hook basal-body protein [Candidatus Competibacteraceae bacterium]|nr:flagellar hook basal-body protein [Candidatus Competibacter sp.]MDG4605057.1 flagellar hook basal-body protein [Candidatus Contendobacter sp.]HRD48389.1 flagellar hook basal-body protein [Candidatus Contendobacter sp.]HRF45409.1 flagellar hook basal-body protein [Candidatus Competibacteraceae bacterium]
MSMYTAVSGVKAAALDLNTTSQNIANASTTGFKNSRAEFGDMVAGKNGIGVQTEAINQLFQQGGVISTGNDGSSGQLDLAIMGNGFFKVTDSSSISPLYTRAGSFHMDATSRKIVNNLGQSLQSAAGADIVVPADQTITSFNSITGTINFSDGTSAQVGLVNFPNAQGLKAVGDTNWVATTASGQATAIAAPGTGTLGNIKGGALEASNVDLTDQLVNMIIAQRNFQANAKVITTENTLSETVINIR